MKQLKFIAAKVTLIKLSEYPQMRVFKLPDSKNPHLWVFQSVRNDEFCGNNRKELYEIKIITSNTRPWNYA